jgi:hypothetical protein
MRLRKTAEREAAEPSIFARLYYDDKKVNDNAKKWACSTSEKHKARKGVWSENLTETDQLDDAGVTRRILLK